jgi:hypothetical protein
LYKLERKTVKEVDIFPSLDSVVTTNRKIQNEINERIKEASQFHHLVKGLLRNKDEKRKLDIFKIYFKRILLYGAETWTISKREESKIQAMEMKFLRAIFKQNKQGQRKKYSY